MENGLEGHTIKKLKEPPSKNCEKNSETLLDLFRT